MPRVLENFPWKTPSQKGHLYDFTTKHHGGPGSAGQAQWLPALTFEAEFWIFDYAEFNDFRDKDGYVFGLLKQPLKKCKQIGTEEEEIAIFFPPSAGNNWHGF